MIYYLCRKMALIKVAALIFGLLSSAALQPFMGAASPTLPASPTHYQGEQASDRFKQTLSGLKSIEAHFSQRVFSKPDIYTGGQVRRRSPQSMKNDGAETPQSA